jgi:hypothetical protein
MEAIIGDVLQFPVHDRDRVHHVDPGRLGDLLERHAVAIHGRLPGKVRIGSALAAEVQERPEQARN